MNPRIHHLLNHPFEVEMSDVALLQDEIDRYPYFSSLRTLLLFGLKEFDHSTYQDELKKTSIYSPSRVALYHYLQKEKQESVPEIEEVEEKAPERVEDYVFESYRKAIEKEKEEAQKSELKVEIPQEIAVSEVEMETVSAEKEEELQDSEEVITPSSELTFSEWLSLSQASQKSNPDEKELTEKDIKFQLIDEFIEKSPKIPPVNKTEEVKPSQSPSVITTEYSDLMTETLAQIYTEQKMYDKAIKAYKILGLKYPEKNEFFANKIQQIEEQRNS